ncbi:beta-lactamase/transpeptidase-like protein [Leucogyrophana mollusca]|uniref:Beta-lactamase/transpeptidase-like protein n=1 Tax=Leucogyrophana mollusca TaxID=85980 RepID=A0ACB8BCK8_9AGAM|nr:beta-lactamase/transpeptidase-like protein [Leucogyrophana mollusca]
MKQSVELPTGVRTWQRTTRAPRWSLVFNAFLLAVVLYLARSRQADSSRNSHREANKHPCRPPLPTLLVRNPPSVHHPALKQALLNLDTALTTRFKEGGIDSLSVAIVASNGSLYESFWGPLRANETDQDKRGTVDRHSIYRLASLSKVSTTMETLILRDRGVLSLDEPISRVFPRLVYNRDEGPITYRQLMSHMSGLGRDLPPGDASQAWPTSLGGGGPPPENGRPFPTLEDIFKAISANQPVVPPYTYPVYSNTGFQLLGMANVAANRAFEGEDAPSTHAQLIHRDVFGPLGFNGTSFLTTDANKHHVAVASFYSHEVDQDFGDASNPSGGQMSSLSDLVKLMQVLIDPSRSESPVSPTSVREWMRPLHTWYDDFSEVGLVWEIESIRDAYGRKQEVFAKAGRLAGHHTRIIINPTSSYGVVLLTTGPTSQTFPLSTLILEQVQEAFDAAIADATRNVLVGTWSSDGSRNNIAIEIDEGSLYVTKYTLNGTNVLAVIQGNDEAQRLPLWSTREDEYRLAFPAALDGCLFSWAALDGYGYIDGVSVNSIRVKQHGNDVVLQFPAIDLEMRRVAF